MTANSIITGSKFYAQKQETMLQQYLYTAEAAQYLYIIHHAMRVGKHSNEIFTYIMHTARVKNPKLV